MNHNEELRHQFAMDSRRVATGAECVIISDSGELNGLLGLLHQNGMLPEHSRIPPESGYDSRSGTAMVIPKGQLAFVVDLLHETRTRIADKTARTVAGQITEDAANELAVYENEQNQDLFQAVKDHIIVVTLSVHGPYGVPNAREHYVYVHTREQSPPQAEIVPILSFNADLSMKWTDR